MDDLEAPTDVAAHIRRFPPGTVVKFKVIDGRVHHWLSDGRHLVLNASGWEEIR